MSGIPLAHDMAHRAIRWAMAISKNQQPEDPRIRESDVRLFLESQPWFTPSLTTEDLYQNAMQLLNSPRELRRSFMLDVLHNVSEPSSGYIHLANLAKRGIVRSILTTNFDDRFEAAYSPGALIVASMTGGYQVISTVPQPPQLVYLHGKAEYYMDRVMTSEVQDIDIDLVNRLLPLLRDHPLVVIGYRGAEPSVMKGLLLDHLDETNYLRQGIFWCVLDGTEPTSLPPMVSELANRIQDNFALVSIAGFDELLDEFSGLMIENSTQGLPYAPNLFKLPPSEEISFDMQPAQQVSRDSLDESLLKEVVKEHSERIGINVPSNPDKSWYEDRLQLMGLLTRDSDGAICPTNAAAILCSNEGRTVSRGHWVEIRTPDRPPNAVDGSLLHVYQSVFSTLQEANRPIRIKGYRSRNQLPYGHIAIKELLANALVHRDYQSPDPTILFIDKDHIAFENPGGLDDPIIQQMKQASGDKSMSSVGEEFQERVYRRDVGATFTAYRNPVLADVFWGMGYVDKAGSGLMDAIHSLREIGASAKIRVPDSNDRFAATISIPHIDIDSATLTAVPKRPALYYSNVVELNSIPTTVWVASSHIKKPRDAVLYGDSRTLSSFSLRNNCLYSFANLSDDDCTLRSLIDPQSIEHCSVTDLIENPSTETIVPELLRKTLEHHMFSRGLRVDRKKSRAYFPCYHSSVRSISYRATRQNTSRRVAWWPVRLGVGHCVHTAVNYRITQLHNNWVLMLQPTYVITTDGKSRQVPFNEHSRIVTGLMTDHYNLKVLADVRFWLNQLETERGTIRIEQPNSPPINIRNDLLAHEGYSTPV